MHGAAMGFVVCVHGRVLSPASNRRSFVSHRWSAQADNDVSATPRPVVLTRQHKATSAAAINAVREYYMSANSVPQRNSCAHSLGRLAAAEADGCRRAVARLLQAPSPAQVVFSSSRLQAFRKALLGVERAADAKDEIIMSEACDDDLFRAVASLDMFRVRQLPICPEVGYVRFESIAAAITLKTKLIVAPLHNKVSGTRQELADVATFIKGSGSDALLVLDAASDLGHVPVDVSKLDADVVFGGCDGIDGNASAGLMCLSARAAEQLAPVDGGEDILSDVVVPEPGKSSRKPVAAARMSTAPRRSLRRTATRKRKRNFSGETLRLANWAEPPFRFEPGMPSMNSLVLLGAAAEATKPTVLKARVARSLALAQRMRRLLGEMDGVEVLQPANAIPQVGVVCFIPCEMSATQVRDQLGERGFLVEAGFHGVESLHRVVYSSRESVRLVLDDDLSEEDVDACALAIGRVLSSSKAAPSLVRE